MSLNYGDLQTLIADDLDRTDLTDQIKREIKRAISHYSAYRFGFNEQSRGLTMTSGTVTLTASLTDVIAIDHLFIGIGGRPIKMTEQPIDVIVEERPTSSSTPYEYAWFQNRLEFNAPPSSAFSLTAYLHFELSELSNDTDQNGWTNEGQDLIRYRAEKILYQNVVKDPQKAVAAQALEKEAFNALRAKNNRRTGGKSKWHL